VVETERGIGGEKIGNSVQEKNSSCDIADWQAGGGGEAFVCLPFFPHSRHFQLARVSWVNDRPAEDDNENESRTKSHTKLEMHKRIGTNIYVFTNWLLREWGKYTAFYEGFKLCWNSYSLTVFEMGEIRVKIPSNFPILIPSSNIHTHTYL
jgi:hypothetical protein